MNPPPSEWLPKNAREPLVPFDIYERNYETSDGEHHVRTEEECDLLRWKEWWYVAMRRDK